MSIFTSNYQCASDFDLVKYYSIRMNMILYEVHNRNKIRFPFFCIVKSKLQCLMEVCHETTYNAKQKQALLIKVDGTTSVSLHYQCTIANIIILKY